MNVLIVGAGGREHALAWKASLSAMVDTVFVAPGNPGTAAEPKCRNVDISVSDFVALGAFAQEHDVGLTIVGPEAPLVDGIRDYFDELGCACFAPSKAAAQLEGSKRFTKDFMARHGIPTADYASFTEFEQAEAYIRDRGAPIVVKADGLAAGKGVVVARTVEEAVDAAESMLSGASFGDAGRRVVVEEFMDGEEASFIVLTDGRTVVPFASSQDHKARDEGDLGPNTGGLGAYSPAPVVSAERHRRIMETIILPTIRGMADDGAPYQGFLYAGLMVTPEDEIKVVEYNCRFGDPEAEPIMVRLRSDLVDCCLRALSGNLEGVDLDFDERVAMGVVMASGGYPLSYATGHDIGGLDRDAVDTKVFHAGTSATEGRVVTSGGRVLCVVGLGDTVRDAQSRTYARVDTIEWPDVYYRRDIGYRAIARETG